MARSTWSQLIGMTSTFIYTCLTLFHVLYLLCLCGVIDLQEVNENLNVPQANVANSEYSHSTTAICIVVCELITYVTMIVASILLQIGIKKERPQLLSPWLCMAGFIIALVGGGLVLSQSSVGVKTVLDISLILLQVVMLPPIYAHYRKMCRREREYLEQSERQRNGAAYYVGRISNAVYAPTTEGIWRSNSLERW